MRAVEVVRRFRERFELVVADTEPLREVAYALRHEVYCLELGYEPVRHDGLERDAYDARSKHYLLTHVPSGAWAGCVRIVRGPDLPCRRVLPALRLPPGAVGEISRLTVAPRFRQAAREDAGVEAQAVLGLALTAVAGAAEAGLDAAVCLMKPRLERQLARYGIRFEPLSEVVEHQGRRALFAIAPQATYREVHVDLQGVLRALRAEIAYAAPPSPRSTSSRPSSATSAG